MLEFRVKPRVVDRLCIAALIGTIFISALARLVSTPSHLPTPDKMYDYTLNTQMSQEVCDQGQYPPSFMYPLPGVLFWHLFGVLNFKAGAMAWLLILPTCMIACVFLSGRLTGLGGKGVNRGVGLVLACIAAEYFLKWDLRVNNLNSFYLLLLLVGIGCWQKEKFIWAGILLGLATALKIYSVALLPYILFRKEWRLALVMILSMVVFFVAVPVLYFGLSETILLTKQWVAAVRSDSRPEFMLSYPAFKVSLAWIAMLLLNPEASHGRHNLVDWSFDSIGIVLHVVCIIWVLMVIAYFVINLRSKVAPERKRLAFMLDVSVLLFCLFPASVFLEPHHLVVLLLPAICLVGVMLSPDFDKKTRVIAGATLAVSEILIEAFQKQFRGTGIMIALVLYLAGIYIIRRGLRADPVAERKTDSIPITPDLAKGMVQGA